MKMIKVHSTNIKSIGWDKGTLRVRFIDTAVYEYSEVPEAVFKSFLKSGSKGRYFIRRIRNKYTTKKISE
jgi:hypothetical protein